MQAPPDFAAISMMLVQAAVVGNKICIRPKRLDDWIVASNLWGFVVGRPGIMKTPAVRQPLKVLQALEIEAKKEFLKKMVDYNVRALIAAAKKKAQQQAVKDAVEGGTDPLEAAKANDVEEEKPPTEPRYITNDATVEKQGVLLADNPNGLMSFRDELTGFLENLDREGQEGARSFYLEAWDGLGSFTYDRIIRGTIHIPKVCLSILGTIQPGRLAGYLAEALECGKADDGLLQRFQLAVYPDVSTNWKNVDRFPDTKAKAAARETIQRLAALDPDTLTTELRHDDGIAFLRFDNEAQEIFDAWRATLEVSVRNGGLNFALESHLAKYRSMVPSLALLCHLADGRTDSVSKAAIEKAILWAEYLWTHAKRIYGMGIAESSPAKKLGERIRKGQVRDRFVARDIYNNNWSGLDREATEAALVELVTLLWLRSTKISTGGAPRTEYRINPAVIEN